MKVVINKCFGGFSLSDKAAKKCIKLGMTVSNDGKGTDFLYNVDPIFDSRYYAMNGHSKEFRTNPIVIKVIEELGKEADGSCAELKIVEIPFDSIDGWEISEYDGLESIEEDHQSWS